MMRIPRVGGVAMRVWLGEALEGIGSPNGAIRDLVRLEDGTHEDHRAAAPYAGFDQIALHAVAQSGSDAMLNVVHPAQPDHRLGARRPVPPVLSQLFDVRLLPGDLVTEPGTEGSDPVGEPVLGAALAQAAHPAQDRIVVLGERAGETALDEVEVEITRVRERRSVCAGHGVRSYIRLRTCGCHMIIDLTVSHDDRVVVVTAREAAEREAA